MLKFQIFHQKLWNFGQNSYNFYSKRPIGNCEHVEDIQGLNQESRKWFQISISYFIFQKLSPFRCWNVKNISKSSFWSSPVLKVPFKIPKPNTFLLKLDRKWPECGPEMAKVWTGSKPEVEMIINSFLWLVWLLISVLVRYEFGEYQHRHNSLQERVCMEHNEQLLKSIFQKWLIHHNRNHQLCLQSWQILAMAMNEELLLGLKWAIYMSHKYESAHDHVRFNEIGLMSDDPGFDRFDSEFERIC